MVSKSVVGFIAVSLLGFASVESAASVCAPGAGSIKDRLSTFSAVFVGRVLAIQVGGSEGSAPDAGKQSKCGALVTFEVLSAWKGVRENKVTLPNHFIYGAGFEVGKTYFVVAVKAAGCEVVCIGCGETKPVDRATDDIRELGDPSFRPSSGNRQLTTG
jgi:hypothetical protein